MAKPAKGWTRRELAATLAAAGAVQILPASDFSSGASNERSKTHVKLDSRQREALKKALADEQTSLAKIRGATLANDVAPAFVIPMPEKRKTEERRS